MRPFDYQKVTDRETAIQQMAKSLADGRTTKWIGGGTNLIDLMKENIERPDALIDVNSLPLGRIEKMANGGLSLGALVSNSKTAYHPAVVTGYPLLAEAILSGASPQLRNMATNGGNLMQRTRCYYFYDRAARCNKRQAGAGCDALNGYNRIHAVLGQSTSCIAVHPSDMCVALAALGAVVRVSGQKGERVIEFREFHRLPGETPAQDNTLEAGELITAIELPVEKFNTSYRYLKVRDRSSYAFALVSAGVAISLCNGRIERAQVALGGVAHKPWRDFEAEAELAGQAPERANFEKFAERVFIHAKANEFNRYKIALGKKVLVRALTEAAQRGEKP